MVSRLPVPGADDGAWGDILNSFLLTSLDATGAIKADTVAESQLAPAVRTKLNVTPPVSSVAGRTGAVTLTKTDVGLANVDNTSYTNKPVSTAVQTALNLKANSSDMTTALAAKADASSVGAKVLLIDTASALPAGTPAGVIVVVKS